MKKTLLFPILLLMSFQCDKSELILDKTCIPVSYVQGICGEAVLKIESDEYAHLGETWNGHESVFFTVLPCGTQDSDFETGPFYVQLKSYAVEECIRCKATIGYDGNKRYSVVIARDCK